MAAHPYYEDELAYLRERGAAFARANPDIAGLLSRSASDPDAERLFEGFAFLTGRLRQRLDEELPELAHGLMALFWPHWLRPVPALAILQFAPADGPTPARIPRGSPVASRPVAGRSCRFRTCFAIDLVPAQVTAARLEDGVGSAALTLVLTASAGAHAGDLAGRRLRVFLHGAGDARAGPRLLRTLLHDVVSVEASDGVLRIVAGPEVLSPGGFGADETLLPWPDHAPPGERILQEYLAFPERCLFVDIGPLPDAVTLAGETLTLTLQLGLRPDLPPRLGPDNFRLNCTPAINLFEADAQPVSPDLRRVEHRILPEPAGARVHSVRYVLGPAGDGPVRVEYPPFESFRHARSHPVGPFYRTRLRAEASGAEWWISFGDPARQSLLPQRDAVSITLCCTDGAAAGRVPIGGIDQAVADSPAGLRWTNITPVAPEAPPPLDAALLWRLLAGLARGLRPLRDVESLRVLLAGLAFRAERDELARRRLELMIAALRDLQVAPMQVIRNGVPVRGYAITLTVAESGFGGTEGAFLFGLVLDRYLTQQAGLNACFQLAMLGLETRARFRWPVRAGQTHRPAAAQ